LDISYLFSALNSKLKESPSDGLRYNHLEKLLYPSTINQRSNDLRNCLAGFIKTAYFLSSPHIMEFRNPKQL